MWWSCLAAELHEDKRQSGIDPSQIVGIARDDDLGGPPRAHDDVRIDDVAGATGGQQESGGRRVRPVQRNEIGARLSDESSEAGLSCGTSDGLRERGCWNGHPHAALGRPREKRQHATVAPIERDQATRIEGDAAHAAFVRRARPFFGRGESRASAHARSRFVSGPPVC